MNREIKFRIWNDYDKKMIYWNELLKNKLANIFTIPSYNKWLMQYTGLHDKNGKEIYEGDIVQGLFADQEEPEIKGQVVYSDGQASYIVIASNNDEWGLGYLDNLEVIGNIYDNPELLGGE